MAQVLLTFKIMPENVDVSLDVLEKKAKEKIIAFGGDVLKVEREPVAFGLVALKVIFALEEAKGSTDNLEEDLKKEEDIMSIEVVDVRRAFG